MVEHESFDEDDDGEDVGEEDGDFGCEYERPSFDQFGTVRVTEDKDDAKKCVLTFWNNMVMKGVPARYHHQLDAFCGDFEHLLNSKTFFEMKYDPGSFDEDVVQWIMSDLEPAINQCLGSKHRKLILEENNGYFTMTVDKPNRDKHNPQENDQENDQEEDEYIDNTD
jgi:hypothetical protein